MSRPYLCGVPNGALRTTSAELPSHFRSGSPRYNRNLGDEHAGILGERIYSSETLDRMVRYAIGRLGTGNVSLDHQDRRTVAFSDRASVSHAPERLKRIASAR